MWPKILIELIPHISRLVPMADKFFSSRSATDDATQQAVTALRSDLASASGTHAALYRQMNEQSALITEAATDARATRAAVLALEARLTEIEQRGRLNSAILAAVLCFTVAILVCALVLLVFRH